MADYQRRNVWDKQEDAADQLKQEMKEKTKE